MASCWILSAFFVVKKTIWRCVRCHKVLFLLCAWRTGMRWNQDELKEEIERWDLNKIIYSELKCLVSVLFDDFIVRLAPFGDLLGCGPCQLPLDLPLRLSNCVLPPSPVFQLLHNWGIFPADFWREASNVLKQKLENNYFGFHELTYEVNVSVDECCWNCLITFLPGFKHIILLTWGTNDTLLRVVRSGDPFEHFHPSLFWQCCVGAIPGMY